MHCIDGLYATGWKTLPPRHVIQWRAAEQLTKESK
jgi:hypothetical protein